MVTHRSLEVTDKLKWTYRLYIVCVGVAGALGGEKEIKVLGGLAPKNYSTYLRN